MTLFQEENFRGTSYEEFDEETPKGKIFTPPRYNSIESYYELKSQFKRIPPTHVDLLYPRFLYFVDPSLSLDENIGVFSVNMMIVL